MLDINTSAVAQHAIQQHHHIDWENAEIVVDHQQELHKRCYSESWQVRRSVPSMNRGTGLWPPVYNCLTIMYLSQDFLFVVTLSY